MCTCRNRDTGGFDKGELVCQSGFTASDSSSGVKEMRKSFSCFRPLGIYLDVKKDCGLNMAPCIVEKPDIDAYQRCSFSKAEKFWDAHGSKFVIAGGVFLGLGLIAAIGSCVAGQVAGAIGGIIVVVIGIILLVCGLVIKRQVDNPNYYIKMGQVI